MAANAMRAGAAYIELQARADRLMSDVQRAARQAGMAAGATLSRSMTQRMASMGSTMRNVGGTMTKSLSLPLAGIGASVIKLGSDFQYQMRRVKNISQATGGDFEMMSKQAKKLGATTQFTATQAAEGMEFLAMAGFKPKQIYEAMPAVLNGAAAANMDLGDTANIVSNIMTGFGLKAGEATRATDLLTKASQMGNVDVAGLGESFKYGGSMAKMAGLSVEETAAAFTLMGNAGMQGSMGGTSVGAALRSMMKPSRFAKKEMEALGLTFQTAGGKLKPLPQIIDEVGKSGITNEQFLRIFGTEGGRAMSALSEQGSDSMRKLTKEIEGSAGTTDRFAKDMNTTAKAGMWGFTSALEGLAIAISESGVLDAFTQVLGKVTEFIQGLNKTNPEILKWGFTLGLLVVAIGPTISAMGFLFGWTARLGPAFRLVSKGATGTAGAVGRLAGGFRSSQVAASQFSGRMGSLGGAIRTGASAVGSGLRTMGTAALGMARTAGTAAASTGRAMLTMAASAARTAIQFGLSMARMAASAAASVARIAIQFTVQAAVATGQFLASMIRVAAVSIAQFAMMSARAIVWAATMAAQWLIAMGPIGWITAAVIALVVLIVAKWDAIKAASAATWDWIWNKIKGFAQFMLDLFMTWSIVGIIISKWDAIKSGTTRLWNGIVNWVKGIPGRIVGFFLNWTLPGLIIKHWGAIKTGTVRVAGQMLTYVKGLPKRIVGFFGNFNMMLYNKGKDLIKGLWKGIKSMGSWLKSTLMGWAKDMIPGPIAKALGIHSPSRVMRDQIGKWIPPGVIDGIDQAKPELDRTMRDLVTVPPLPKLPALDAPGVNGNTPLGAVPMNAGSAPALLGRRDGVTVNVRTNANPYEIGKAIAWEVRTSGR
jgi:TP901 family phage tail tape measure protein